MFWRKDQELLAEQSQVDDIVSIWARTCEAVSLCNDVETVSGTTHVVPRVEYVILGPPTRLTVRLPPGIMPDDITAVGTRIARSMGAAGIRVEPRGYTHAVVTLLTEDPLAESYRVMPDQQGPVFLGIDESGTRVELDKLTHTILAGSTGSGKSIAAYSLLSQLYSRPDVRICGADASGLLFRPMPPEKLRVSGLSDVYAIELALGMLVQEMDRRISRIPMDTDSLPTDAETPLMVCVLEEYPGVLRALDAIDTKLAKRVRLHVARLLAESRKAGMVVTIIAQRAEAQIIGAAERAQCPTRITFGVSSVEDVKLLHPEAATGVAEGHVQSPAGVGLVSMPGQPVQRIRAPYVEYPEFVKAVQS